MATRGRKAYCPGTGGVSGYRLARAAPDGLSRRREFKLQAPTVRDERSMPGELIHIDIEKLGRIQWAGNRVAGNRRDRQRH